MLRRVPLLGEEADRVLNDLPPDRRLEQAWLVAPDGRRWAGPEAVWHALYLSSVLGLLLRPLRGLPGFHPLSRQLYQSISSRRRSQGCRLDRQ
jgi:hypothetical protein